MITIISRSSQRFKNRREAGQLLGEELKRLSGGRTVVLGIPRGGVIIAAEIARGLGAQLDIVLAHKLSAPGNPELAIGAVDEQGRLFLNESLASRVGADKKYIDVEKAHQSAEIRARVARFRQVREKVPLKGKTVIITDDGIATGATMEAALWSSRQENPAQLIVAVPVAAEEAVESLAGHCDEVLVLRLPDSLGAIGQFYDDFGQTPEEEVLGILQEVGK